MKIHDVTQRTPEWYALRLGRPTASNFDKIVTASTGKLSMSSTDKTKPAGKVVDYACLLIAERLTGESQSLPLDSIPAIARGRALEPDAISLYEYVEEVETRPVGFVTTDDGLVGASPDRLIVGAPAGLEIKCPLLHTHIGYWATGLGTDYRAQVQGSLFVCEAERWDFNSYHPQMERFKLRTYRDDAYIQNLAQALADFNELTAGIEAKVRPLFYGAPNLAELLGAFAQAEAA